MTDIFPTLRYNDAHAAIDHLVKAFGFTKRAVHEDDNGVVQHAQLAYGDGMIMLGDAPREPDSNRLDMPIGGGSVYIVTTTPTRTTSAPGRPASRSGASCATRTTGRAATPPRIPRATSGASAPTGPDRARAEFRHL
jgi:uncharacterized glyoxalase superfamily protein PhnB